MRQLVTLTGPSGAGKTAIVTQLLRQIPASSLVTSTTTRLPRPTDMRGEYRYVTGPEFDEFDAAERFLWTTELGGIRYGTMGEDVLQIFRQSQIGFMLLMPDVINRLLRFLHDKKDIRFRLMFIRPPHPEVLRVRMRERGDDPASIEKRMASLARWDPAVLNRVRIPPEIVPNDGDLQAAVDSVRQRIESVMA